MLLARQHHADEVKALIMKHLTPMRLLNRIGELMRAMRMLTPDEITELCRLCAEYGKAHRASFPERPSAPRLTPKAHTIEKHIPLIAQRFGTIGLFGQDGGVAAHPKCKTASKLCRCVSNTIPCVKATKFHFEAQKHFANINR